MRLSDSTLLRQQIAMRSQDGIELCPLTTAGWLLGHNEVRMMTIETGMFQPVFLWIFQGIATLL